MKNKTWSKNKLKKLLIEHTTLISVEKPQIIESLNKNDGKLILRNVLLQRADRPNRNNRIYPKRVLEREINSYSTKVKERRAFGECDHPDSQLINLKNVCQAIIDVKWKGNDVYGDVEILNTPSGNIIKEILLAGFRVGQSSRGMGSVKELNEEDGVVEVDDDFELVTLADCVSDESTYGANMRITESYNSTNKLISKNKIFDELIREIRCELTGQCCIQN